MTTPKEALERLRRDMLMYIDAGVADDDLSHTVKVSHINFVQWHDLCDAALASLEGDAVERVAQTIREYCIGVSPASIQLSHGVERIYYAGLPVLELARAILNTGLVPDEAARPLSDVFNELVRRMNFDGMDPRTFTLGELERAIEGAEFPK